jgi:hypothetical protein
MGRKRRKVEEVDVWCRNWARQRRIALGLISPEYIQPWEQLGQMRCTLAKVREDKVGAGYSTKLSQQFPEVYSEDCLVTHLGIMALPSPAKLIVHLHYVRVDLRVYQRAAIVPMSETRYWETLRLAKQELINFVHGFQEKAAA